MPRYTSRWGLSVLGSGDSFQSDGFKFTDADRRLIDRLLTYAAEQHHHTGERSENLTPTAGPTLNLSTSGGTLASGARFYYRYTIVDDIGNETGPSPMGFIDTPATIETPGAPALAYLSGTGGLEPGGYSYVLSAYRGASTQETKAINSSLINITGAYPTNEVTLTLPAPPPGADGLNVYRRTPSGMHYLYLTSLVAPTSGQAWTDDGSIEGDCDRSLPSINRTGGTNMVTVALPGATPVLGGPGSSWRIYRTSDPSHWGRSYLVDVVPTGATPVTALSFDDIGLASQVGGPPTTAQLIDAPAKIAMTNGAEVDGALPPGLIVVPQMLTFVAPGVVQAQPGTFTWICDYDMADVVSLRVYLGIGSVPAQQDLIIDLLALRPSAGSSSWESLFTPDTSPPTLPVGQNMANLVVPVRKHLERGDALSVDVLQAGGGPTPTDKDLSVNLLLKVKDGSETESYVWG